jgi:flagellar biosynthesis/type III secretory pathway protein FliH
MRLRIKVPEEFKGQEDAYLAGYDEGHDDGYDEGYGEGYEDGQNSQTTGDFSK